MLYPQLVQLAAHVRLMAQLVAELETHLKARGIDVRLDHIGPLAGRWPPCMPPDSCKMPIETLHQHAKEFAEYAGAVATATQRFVAEAREKAGGNEQFAYTVTERVEHPDR